MIVKNKKWNRKNKKRLAILLGSMVFICLIYLLGFLYFGSHFLPNTKIDEVAVGGMSSKDADEKLKEIEPCLNVIQKNKEADDIVTEKIGLRKMDPGISYETDGLLKEQNRLSWFASLFSQKDLTCNKIKGGFDQTKVKDLIKGLYCLSENNIVRPEDASLAIENGKIVLKEEIEGSYISEEKVASLIAKALEDLFAGEGDGTLDLTKDYEAPLIRKDDPSFSGKIAQYQKVLDKSISIDIDSYQEESLKGNELCDLLAIRNGELAIDEDKLSDYISSFCRRYDVSDYEYIDRSSLKNDLERSLLSEEDQNIGIEWIYEETEKLIEVCISEQMLYYYENRTLILSSPVVTGNGNITDATPTGYFSIRKMKQDSWLVGAGYEEHVDYWIGFDETGRIYGLHDASWRDEFGGDIWLTDPSRGCVNMPLSKISQLWDYVDIGTEVHIYE